MRTLTLTNDQFDVLYDILQDTVDVIKDDLIEYEEHHHDEIVAGDHHDPNCLELFCDQHPDEPECLVYDD